MTTTTTPQTLPRVPAPGTAAAVRAGCTCPIRDNRYGHGRPTGGWVYDGHCPLHCPPPRTLAERIADGMDDLHGGDPSLSPETDA
jgi:hypothetical protein